MKIISPIILSVAPGNREIGVAVFNEARLIYFAVKPLYRRHSATLQKQEIIKLFDGLFISFPVDFLALKVITRHQKQSDALGRIVALIERLAKNKQITVVKVSLAQIKTLSNDGGKPSERKTFQWLTVLYPELRQYLNRPNKWQNDYYAFLFSSVAAGVVCLKSFVKFKK